MRKSLLLLLMGAFLVFTTACSNSTPEVDDQEVISDSVLVESPLVDTINFSE